MMRHVLRSSCCTGSCLDLWAKRLQLCHAVALACSRGLHCCSVMLMCLGRLQLLTAPQLIGCRDQAPILSPALSNCTGMRVS